MQSKYHTTTFGDFMDGVSPVVHEVFALINPVSKELVLMATTPASKELARWPLSEVHIDAQQGGKRFHVHRGTHTAAVLTSKSPELLEALIEKGCDLKAAAGHRGPKRVALSLIVGIVLAVSGIYASLPVISQGIATAIPLKYERVLGSNIQTVLQWDYCESEQGAEVLTRYANLIGPERAGQWEVHITGSSVPNAFALPGGVIVFTKGALEISEGMHEILGVLAHEIEHVDKRHVLTSVVRSTILTSLWSLTVGDYAGLMVVDPGTAYNIANLKFSRDTEAEADRGAVKRLLDNNLPTAGLAEFLDKLGHEEGDLLELISTHPATDSRVEMIGELSEELRSSSWVLDREGLEADWEIVRGACLGDEEG